MRTLISLFFGLIVIGCSNEPDTLDLVQQNINKFEQLKNRFYESTQNSNLSDTTWKGTIEGTYRITLDSTFIELGKELEEIGILYPDTSIFKYEQDNLTFKIGENGRSTYYVHFDPDNLISNIGITDEHFYTKLKDQWYFEHFYNRDPDFKE